MVSAAYLYERAFTTCVKTVNKNNTRSNNQPEQKYGILQGVINGTGIKQVQNEFNR